MTDEFDRDEEKEFDPADLKKKSAFDLLEVDEIDDEIKVPEIIDEEDEDGFAFYEADDDTRELYSI